MAAEKDLPRPAREARPAFRPEEPVAERLANLFMNLATEVAVLRERLDTVERLLDHRGQLTRADIEAYDPDETAAAERRALREHFIRRVFAELEAEIDAAVSAAGTGGQRSTLAKP